MSRRSTSGDDDHKTVRQCGFLDTKGEVRQCGFLDSTSLEIYETGILPWDIEMTVEESLSDDEGGVPHSVSDSEFESENDSD